MKITLTIHREFPSTPAAADRSVTTTDEAGTFLSEAVERIAAGIGSGEQREVGVGIKVIG